MIYLHNSDLGMHGNLRSSNCVITSRWTLQVTDFGIHELRFASENSPTGCENPNNFKLLWKAPEQLRDLREEVAGVQSREIELTHKKSDLEKQLQLSEAETLTLKNDLKLALRRIDDLQAAIGGEIDSDFVSGDVSDSDTSDEDVATFLENRRTSR